jgi:hypothetical protein
MSFQIDAIAEPTNGCEPVYRLGPEVLLVPVEDGSARLLDFAGITFALSEVAARMLRDTLELGAAGAAESSARHWSVEPARVRADLEALLANLVQQGLLVDGDEPPRRPGFSQSHIAGIIAVLVRLTCLLRPTAAGKASGLLTVANLSCRWLGWAQTVRTWQRLFPSAACPLEGDAAEEARQMVDIAVRQTLAHSAMYHACKERGLTGWALARRAGLSPLLVIGISLCPLHAHCWAQLGPHFLGDSPDRCLPYQPVRTYE